MIRIESLRREHAFPLLCLIVMLLVTTLGVSTWAPNASGQEDSDAAEINAADIQAVMNDEGEPEQAPPAEPTGIDLLSLIASGGRFMIPIGLMSLLVVALATERTLSLRRNKVIPRQLINELSQLADPVDKLNPKLAYLACRDHPSPTGHVIGSMMLRTGQSLGEIERTANEAAQRQADPCRPQTIRSP